MEKKHETASNKPLTWESGGYWGVCPQCRRNDGYLNVGRSHWFYCKEHRIKWCSGSNLFSSWRDETEEEQRRKYDEIGLGAFEDINPNRPPVDIDDLDLNELENSIKNARPYEARLEAFGFTQAEFGQWKASNCRVILYRVDDEYQIDIILPNDSAVGFDVPVEKFGGRTADEIRAARATNASNRRSGGLIDDDDVELPF